MILVSSWDSTSCRSQCPPLSAASFICQAFEFPNHAMIQSVSMFFTVHLQKFDTVFTSIQHHAVSTQRCIIFQMKARPLLNAISYFQWRILHSPIIYLSWNQYEYCIAAGEILSMTAIFCTVSSPLLHLLYCTWVWLDYFYTGYIDSTQDKAFHCSLVHMTIMNLNRMMALLTKIVFSELYFSISYYN